MKVSHFATVSPRDNTICSCHGTIPFTHLAQVCNREIDLVDIVLTRPFCIHPRTCTSTYTRFRPSHPRHYCKSPITTADFPFRHVLPSIWAFYGQDGKSCSHAEFSNAPMTQNLTFSVKTSWQFFLPMLLCNFVYGYGVRLFALKMELSQVVLVLNKGPA